MVNQIRRAGPLAATAAVKALLLRAASDTLMLLDDQHRRVIHRPFHFPFASVALGQERHNTQFRTFTKPLMSIAASTLLYILYTFLNPSIALEVTVTLSFLDH